MCNDDGYGHKPEDFPSVIDSCKKNIEDYKAEITNLNTLVTQIEGSSSWKDALVKTAFIRQCKSYITIYQTLSSNMENLVAYLVKKNSDGELLDSAYTKG